jgi:SH3 domain protein
LVSEPIAKDQLQGVKTALEAAEQSNNLLTIELKTALDAKAQANAAATSSRAALMETQANLERLQALSRDAQITAEQLTNTKEKNRQLAADLAKLQAAQSQQHDDVHKRWFLTGSGVVFISLLLGFWVSRRIYHRSLSGGWS